QTAWWRTSGRRLDGRGPAEGRARARDPAGPNPLQHLQLAPVRRGDARLSRIAALRGTGPDEPLTDQGTKAVGIERNCIFEVGHAVGEAEVPCIRAHG